MPLIIPENGLIALNPPLTLSRIGANSTRTAHPFYLSSLQYIFDTLKIPATIQNPYQFCTKGEMIKEAINDGIKEHHLIGTVSCGHWKRSGKQCGRCWPCLIRRSSFHAADIVDATVYEEPSLKIVLEKDNINSDLIAARYGFYQYFKYGRKSKPIQNIRLLPEDPHLRKKHLDVVDRGFNELGELFLSHEVFPS